MMRARMAAATRYLADTSALARLHHPEAGSCPGAADRVGEAAATCGIIEFELGLGNPEQRGARSGASSPAMLVIRWLATHDEDWRRALDVQAALWRGGRMRALGWPTC